MASDLNRRRFLQSAGVGIVAGAVATVATPAMPAEKTSALPAIPLPDAHTKATAVGTGPQAACCVPASKLIFACSGSADVGKICDSAARKLSEEGVGKMFCLAGVGGRVKAIMDGTQSAQAILVLDGCPLQCARNTMQQAGFTKFEYLCLSDMGMEKGKTPATEETVAKVANRGKSLLPK
jgi:uncharacterized metal-binding protein